MDFTAVCISLKKHVMKYAIIALTIAGGCLYVLLTHSQDQAGVKQQRTTTPPVAHTAGEIPLPEGYERISLPASSFGAYLRTVPLKDDNTVYLYNGAKKANQNAQYRVLDVTVGKKDLQQCADAIMRLYAEYQYAGKKYNAISFNATDGSPMDYASWMNGYRFSEKNNRLQKQKLATPCSGRDCFEKYLETVFLYAGTLSLSQSLQPVKVTEQPTGGNVFIKGGSPGHAVIVMDVARHKTTGDIIFLLAQSYMPAQDIHILKNPLSPGRLSPWYQAVPDRDLVTPEWIFKTGSLKRFPDMKL